MVHFSSLIAASLAATLSVSGFPLSARQDKDFTLQNGLAAQGLNADFAALSADSPCDTGDKACINGQFAQCVDGQFSLVSCGGGLQCLALPLVNNPGTTVTCSTVEEAEARIANTGATGGITGGKNANVQSTPAPAPSPSPSPSPSPAPPAPPASAPARGAQQPPAAPAADNKDFALQNGIDAQGLNAEFSTLNANSPCEGNELACVNGSFAQCVDGRFQLTPCAGGAQCFGLPLVLNPGTTITCSTEADAIARIAATGATGGIQG